MHDFAAEIEELESRTLLRKRREVGSPCTPELEVDRRSVLAFCSNDYLGLANNPELVEAAQEGAKLFGIGSGASPLINGFMNPHCALEHRLEEFTGMERVLFFSNGYMANIGTIPALVGRGDEIFCDRLNHASLIDASRLSRANICIYPHCELDVLRERLAASSSQRKLILTDAVFSMDGDIAPLVELLALAEEFDAWLMIDDAHGFGVLGPYGRGSAAHFHMSSPRLIYMGTLGKAAGVAGAFVAGADKVIEWLLQRARTYVFSTSEPPLIAYTLLKSIDLIERGDERRRHLSDLIALLQRNLKLRRWKLLPSATAIQPLVIGDNAETMKVANSLFERGIWVPGIRPPTVPEGTSRLRITLSAAHKREHVEQLITTLCELE